MGGKTAKLGCWGCSLARRVSEGSTQPKKKKKISQTTVQTSQRDKDRELYPSMRMRSVLWNSLRWDRSCGVDGLEARCSRTWFRPRKPESFRNSGAPEHSKQLFPFHLWALPPEGLATGPQPSPGLHRVPSSFPVVREHRSSSLG